MPHSKFPIVIAGGGPVGLTLSALLSRSGVKNVVLDRASKMTEHPQAHFLTCRTMEVFRHAFGPETWASLQSSIPPLYHWRHFAYCISLLGRQIGRVDHFAGLPSSCESPTSTPPSPIPSFPSPPPPAQTISQHSPTHVAHLSQSKLMPHLLEAARRSGSTVMHDREVEDYTENNKGVSVSVRKVEDGTFETWNCRYLVAADGANSKIRKHAGIHMEGPGELQHLLTVHFTSKDLAAALKEKGHDAMLHFVYNKDVICVVVAHDFRSGEFVCQMPIFPPVQDVEDFNEQRCRELLSGAIGRPVGPDTRIHSIKPWVMHCQVADRYFSRTLGGRVILAGDAAHRFPPAGGFGMNTGIQDAHNLAWKLALVMKEEGAAANHLLHSYEAERRPAAAIFADLSLRNYTRSLRLPKALGLDVEKPKEIAQSTSPLMAKSAFEGVLAVGRRPLISLETPGHPYGETCMQRARQILRDGAGLPLLFPLHDLGGTYEASPPESLQSVLDTPNNTEPRRSEVHDAADMLSSVRVGARMPHLLLSVNGSAISAVDLPDQLMSAAASETAGLSSNQLRGPLAVFLTDGSATLRSLTWEGAQVPVITARVESVAESSPKSAMPPESPKCVTVAGMPDNHRSALFERAFGDGVIAVSDAWGQWKEVVGQNMGVLIRPDGYVWLVAPADSFAKC